MKKLMPKSKKELPKDYNKLGINISIRGILISIFLSILPTIYEFFSNPINNEIIRWIRYRLIMWKIEVFINLLANGLLLYYYLDLDTISLMSYTFFFAPGLFGIVSFIFGIISIKKGSSKIGSLVMGTVCMSSYFIFTMFSELLIIFEKNGFFLSGLIFDFIILSLTYFFLMLIINKIKKGHKEITGMVIFLVFYIFILLLVLPLRLMTFQR